MAKFSASLDGVRIGVVAAASLDGVRSGAPDIVLFDDNWVTDEEWIGSSFYMKMKIRGTVMSKFFDDIFVTL